MPHKYGRYKSSKCALNLQIANKSTIRKLDKLPEMPDAITSKLGQLNYYSKLNRKDTDFRVKLMSNRIERLKSEERRANVKIKQTSKKANEFISTRNKYYDNKKMIINHKLKVENETQSKRQTIIQNNSDRK